MSWGKSLDELIQALGETRSALELYFDPAVALFVNCFAKGGKVLTCGNGGSAAQASHLAAELSVRFAGDRIALPALSLTDPVALTACANDYGYHHVFERQIEALGRSGDVLVAFSTSGKSINVNGAVRRAMANGLRVLGLSGNTGMAAYCDVDIVIRSKVTARIQEAHQFVIHAICEALDQELTERRGQWAKHEASVEPSSAL